MFPVGCAQNRLEIFGAGWELLTGYPLQSRANGEMVPELPIKAFPAWKGAGKAP
jgi:hypothetical protein